MPRARFQWLVFVLAGCGDDAVSTDAGPDVDVAPEEILDVEPPVAPEAPRFTPCPPGWTAEEEDGVATCAPFEGRDPPQCTGATMAIPSEGACVRVGRVCPGEGDDPYPPDLPDTNVVYVDATAGGTLMLGTREAPYPSLLEATRDSPAGQTYALAPGDYEAGFTFARPAHVRGACAERTRLVVSEGPLLGILADGTTLHDLTLVAAEDSALVVDSATDVVLEDVVIEQGADVAFTVQADASVTARNLVVRNSRRGPFEATAIGALGGSTLAITRGEIDGSEHVGAFATRGSRLDLLDVHVHGIEGDVDPVTASGVLVNRGSTATLRASVFRDSAGPLLATSESTVRVSQSLFTDGRSVGLIVHQGDLTLERVLVTDVAHGGVNYEEAAGSVTDTVVRRVSSPGTTSYGVSAEQSVVRVERIHVADVDGAALSARTNSALTGSDVWTVRGGGAELLSPAGVELADHVEASLSRLRLEAPPSYGLVVLEGTTAQLEDVDVRDVRSSEGTLDRGFGLLVNHGSTLTVARFRSEAARSGGILVAGTGTSVDGTDVEIARTIGEERSGALGRGIEAQDHGVVMLDRVRVDHARELAVAVFDVGTRLALSNARILDVLGRRCSEGEGDCVEDPLGVGLGCYQSVCELERFEIERANLCAVHAAFTPELALRNGAVRSNPIAICYEGDAPDPSSFSTNVLYEDNATNIDSRVLPVPAPANVEGL